jgi:glucan phosphoethanolaminetransferase (alkaline phosphatase superfamily)
MASRLALAIVFIISGLTGFLDFETFGFFTPDDSLLTNISNTPHFYALKITEFIVGLAFILNFFIPTALIVSLPIAASAITYHFWVDPRAGLISLLLMVPIVTLIYFYRDTYALFFNPQINTNHMAEDSPRILTYDEVREKTPGLEIQFEKIYDQVHP